MRGSGIGGGPYPLPGEFDSRPRDHGPVAQPGSAAPLQGEGCGFDSRTVHTHHADVAQLAEARRPDRRQCRFESDRQYHLDVAQRERTGFGSRGLEVRALPSRPMRGGGTGTTPGSEPGGPRSCAVGRNPTVASQLSMPLRLSRTLTVESACCADGGSFDPYSRGRGFESRHPDRSGCSSAWQSTASSAAWFPGRHHRIGLLRRQGFLRGM